MRCAIERCGKRLIMVETITYTSPNLTKPIDAVCIIDSDYDGLFGVYLEFVLYWIKSDAQCYRNMVMMLTGREEKWLLSSLVVKKMEMFDVFKESRGKEYKEWFEPAFIGNSQSGNGHGMTDFASHPIHSVEDAFYFAYRKEYQGLALFEKISRSDLGSDIRDLMESAAERQRQLILFLDEKLTFVRRQAERMRYSFSLPGSTVNQWALMYRSE